MKQSVLLNRSTAARPADMYLTAQQRNLITRVARSHDRKHFYRGTAGVRGAFTAATLRSHGLEAAELGCPSLFLNTRAHLGRRLEAKYRTLARRLLARDAAWSLGGDEAVSNKRAQDDAPLRIAVVFGRGQKLWNQLLLGVAVVLNLKGSASLLPVVQDKNDLMAWTSRLCNSSQPLAPPEIPWRGIKPVSSSAFLSLSGEVRALTPVSGSVRCARARVCVSRFSSPM
jgi:hypothetical protein